MADDEHIPEHLRRRFAIARDIFAHAEADDSTPLDRVAAAIVLLAAEVRDCQYTAATWLERGVAP